MNTLKTLMPYARKFSIEFLRYAMYALCVLLLVNYIEVLYAFYNAEVFMDDNGRYYLYTPISMSIGKYITITAISNIFLLTISIALHFCWRYVIGVLYIFTVLIQRAYLDSFLISNLSLYITCYTNIVVILIILYLGIKQQFINHKGRR